MSSDKDRSSSRGPVRPGRDDEPMAVAPLSIHSFDRIDLDAFKAMVARGELEDCPVELLHGELRPVSPPTPGHAAVVDRLLDYLGGTRRWHLRVQSPVEVLPDSSIEPDLAVLRQPSSPNRHPRSALLAVEVAVSSQHRDRNEKGPLYAQAQIPIYWLVDVRARAVEVWTLPRPHGYGKHEIYGENESVPAPLQGLPDLDLTELLRGVPKAPSG